MGGLFWAHITTWTFLFSIRMALTDQNLGQEFSLITVMDAAKINISQDEYSRMMNTYLDRVRATTANNFAPELQIFDAVQTTLRRRKKCTTKLRFPKLETIKNADIEQVELRVLMSPFSDTESPTIRIYQVSSGRNRRLLMERKVYLSQIASKWCEFDLTEEIKSWDDQNFGLELHCSQCSKGALRPIQSTLSILAYRERERVRRSTQYENNYEGGRTDCSAMGNSKQRCCRHTMTVTFKDLKVPQISSIIQPKSYDAGYCKGRCPYNYNHATNHSRIQSLVHKLDRKAVPRVCCAPSKLAPLDILRVDPYDFTKLNVEKWDNMKVLECACS